MSDDDLLERLGRLAREGDGEESLHLDPRWDELAAGTLSAEQEAELRREAATDPQLAQALEAFTPLGASVRREILAAARRELAPQPGAQRASESHGTGVPAPLLRGRRGWIGGAAAALLLVAVLVLWGPGGTPPVPAYQASLQGVTQELRGTPGTGAASSGTLTAGNAFELVLTPREPVVGSVATLAFVQAGKGPLRPWYPPVEIATSGSVRIAGTVGREIDLPLGEVTLWVVVGRRRALPSAEELRGALEGQTQGASAGAKQRWLAWRWPLVVVEERSP